MKILVLYFSQSGDVLRAAQALTGPLSAAGATVDWQPLRPQTAYPFPWKKLETFFGVLPACVLQQPPPINPPEFEPTAKYDLVILAWQVWFLAPSLPFQAFFRTPHAAVLRGTPCITLTVCRDMWLTAFTLMRRLVAAAGGQLLANVTVTHQGPVWARFITTMRSLLFGKPKNSKLLPAAGVADQQLERVAQLGRVLAERLQRGGGLRSGVLDDQPTASVSRAYVLPELFARRLFQVAAHTVTWLERRAYWLRRLGLYGSMLALLASILCLMPLGMLSYALFQPLARRLVDSYVRRVAAV